MGAVRDNNFFVVHGWMINRLGLKGNELQVYAIIYGFSQADGTEFAGNLQYLADWTNATKRTALNSLQGLVEKGLLTKEDVFTNGVKACKYRCILEGLDGEKTSPGAVKNLHQGGEKTSPGVLKKLHQGGEKTSTNNINNNIPDIDIDNKEGEALTPAPVPLEPPKRKSGKAYKLTAPEIEAILARYAPTPAALELLRDWMNVRKAKRAPETEKALSLNLVKLDKLARDSGLTVEGYLEAVIARGWAAFFPINETRSAGQAPVNIRSRVKTEAEHAAGQTASGLGGW